MGTKGSKLHLACGQWKKQRNDTIVRKRQIAVSGLLDGILGTFQSQKTHAPGFYLLSLKTALPTMYPTSVSLCLFLQMCIILSVT